MTYAQGYPITAADFENIFGDPTGHGANLLNTIWAQGYNDAGYGQTAVPMLPSVVDYSIQVTATQWATAINALNNTYNHQSGVSSTISAPTAGMPINWFSLLTTKIQTAYSNRLLYNSSGTSGQGAGYSFRMNALWDQSCLANATIVLSLGTADQARYFFNAGGKVGIRIDLVSTNATNRSLAISDLAVNFGQKTLYARTAAARTGSGGSVTTDLTNKGYYDLTTSPVVFTGIQPSSGYGSDYIACEISSNGTQGSLGDKGNQITLGLAIQAAAGSSEFNNLLDATVSYNVYWTYPETTYLSASWGTVSVLSASSTINITINSDTANYNLFTAVGSPTTAVAITLTIQPSVYVYSSSTSTYSLDTGSGWPVGSSIAIVNNGIIVGMGGAGGNGQYATPDPGSGGVGAAGGPALRLQYDTTITGSGFIVGGGGGGGGGGSGYRFSGVATHHGSGGGGGGGGGGKDIGTGGSGGGTSVTGHTGSPGDNGTTAAGGNGGAGGPDDGFVSAGGAGGDGGYGTAGTAGSNGNGLNRSGTGGLGGAAGNAITGNSNVLSNSNTVIGPTS